MRTESDHEGSGGALLSKSVAALAIEPLTMALTVTSRKAYDVMLWISQRQRPSGDGFFSSPVAAILKGYGSDTRLSERLQEYLEQMVQTTVIWRPLTETEPVSLTLEGMETPQTRVSDEQRTFPLLAEVRRYQRAGEAWVSWFYPPSIREQLINPERWAQLELTSIARLSTYTAVALYEICARYKDSPGGMTGRYDPDFLGRVLREQAAKPRPWRKFKHELVGPAIAEINAVSEIELELIEHRRGRSVAEVQFKVTRKAKRPGADVPQAVDVTLSMEAGSLGIRESDLDTLVSSFGVERVQKALDILQERRVKPGAAAIPRPGAYLAAILNNGVSASDTERRPSLAAAPVAVGTPPPAETRTEVIPAATVAAPAWESMRVSALKVLAGGFGKLPMDDRLGWLRRLSVERGETLTPASRRRIEAGQWESPVVKHLVLSFFATETYGEDWVRKVLEEGA